MNGPIYIEELAELSKKKAADDDIPLEEAVGFVLKGHTELFYKVLGAARGEKRKISFGKSPFYEDSVPPIAEEEKAPAAPASTLKRGVGELF